MYMFYNEIHNFRMPFLKLSIFYPDRFSSYTTFCLPFTFQLLLKYKTRTIKMEILLIGLDLLGVCLHLCLCIRVALISIREQPECTQWVIQNDSLSRIVRFLINDIKAPSRLATAFESSPHSQSTVP